MSKIKIKCLSRNPDDYVRETKKDIHKVPRNYDPKLHPFEAPREYTRALNAVKLERVFAKPFLGSLDGHRDGVHCLCKHPRSLSTLLSGACDGEGRSVCFSAYSDTHPWVDTPLCSARWEIRATSGRYASYWNAYLCVCILDQIKVWNLPNRECKQSINAHDGFVRGICFNPSGEHFFSCGDDKTIKQWNTSFSRYTDNPEPTNTIIGKTVFQGIDHHLKENKFATCGEVIDIWDEERSEPVRSFTWGVDSVHSLKFNPVETNIIGSTASDRSIMLYDMRGSTPLRKVILKLKSNKLVWNPLEAFTFTVANEDYNLYSFDMRKLSMPVNVHMDHVSAVLDVDYSPTGREFVSGSFDKSIRIFPVDKPRSREIYHTKRMQHVITVAWSLDDKYIISGSDEMNLRMWKANASEKLGALKPREKAAKNYNEKLKEKFAHHPQVKRIARHRHVPKSIYSAAKEHRIIKHSQRRKETNRRLHSKPGSVPFVPEKKKHTVSEIE